MKTPSKPTPGRGEDISASELEALGKELSAALKVAQPAEPQVEEQPGEQAVEQDATSRKTKTSAVESHPNDADLAQFVAGAATESDRERIEHHLISCAECRSVVLVAGAEETSVANAPAPAARPVATWLAAAAVLIAAAVGGWWLWRGGSHETLGLEVAAYQGLDDGGDAVALLEQGLWPRSSLLEQFQPAAQTTAVRSHLGARLQPVSPRWSTISERAGALGIEFAFSVTGTQTDVGEVGAARYEVLVLDANDAPVARWMVSDDAGGLSQSSSGSDSVVVTAIYPTDAPKLLAASTYAWKVNRHLGEETIASAYVPFELRSRQQERELERTLKQLRHRPADRALELARAGALDRAVTELVDGASRPSEVKRARELAVQLLEATGLETDLAERWTDVLRNR